MDSELLERPTPVLRDIGSRLMDFSVLVIGGLESLRYHPEGRFLVGQLFRSATAIGANYEEAQAAESRADFTHKMQIALKESRETAYWLQPSQRVGWFENAWRERALRESQEITRILAKSVVTAKAAPRERSRNFISKSASAAALTFSFCLFPFAL